LFFIITLLLPLRCPWRCLHNCLHLCRWIGASSSWHHSLHQHHDLFFR
jgi:hypothetical protein